MHWRFDLPEEVHKRAVKGGAGRNRFDLHQHARGNGNGDGGVRYD